MVSFEIKYLYSFLSGMVMLGCWAAGLFFFRFYRQTLDRFFKIFAAAFWILGFERLIPLVWNLTDEPRTYLYVIRLLAFLLILYAIYEKNRET